ncbi:TetR/AcrR family transcriptional regulator [Roseibium aggregatum]|uniref:TetR/AcrR family transcriptional regulator n=1 Tax=Roseibium aggregatum TaxID=187304 RepID=A0A926S5V3_9HYPH|nr:TetR/AcrR family transcriptional regulator [Roseibium aggregatum]MBD1546565.1 TetR/AcrR family transcriptional regulator [Roseibium aggregatum]
MNQRLTPRKQPRQKRSQETCAIILEAAARILESDGLGGLTTNRVAEIAGVSVGSLYQYFPSKEAILAEMIRGLRRSLLLDCEAAVETVRGRPLSDAVDVMVRASLRHHLVRPGLARVLERAEEELPLEEDLKAIKGELMTLVTGVLEERDVANAGQAAFDLIALSHGLASAAIAGGETDLENLFQRLRRAALGYLGLQSDRTGSDAGGVSAA